MNENFISIKAIDGDLKISHKKRDFGITVSTKELIYQKPHANYHIKLEDILSIVPFDTAGVKAVTFHNRRASGEEIINMSAGIPHYRVYARQAVLHNRSGLFPMGGTQLILPILKDLLLAISKYGGLNAVT
ncbi:hypothetical protein [Paenibacillus xerothermodurans]|uniref:Uncharacterized protein n=1 Tax=Paenibacillus xerothermodurans TaxID=1977292 RepID=A0A2W1NVF5_PAEXE|nr:hypothetical protein [Paenibacillus xerothermodurans]PZE21756.1 hypothetical protein CBW46_004905 [Paenibacillus xerothermodurans]